MSKRFTDTDKWKKQWFRKLKNDNKVFWMYLLDQCNHAGIWEVDFELANYFCKGINEQEIRKVIDKQYIEFANKYDKLIKTNKVYSKDKINNYFSNCIFIIYEIHNLRD